VFHLNETRGIPIYKWFYALTGSLYSQAMVSSGLLVPGTLGGSSGQPGSDGDSLQPVSKLSVPPISLWTLMWRSYFSFYLRLFVWLLCCHFFHLLFHRLTFPRGNLRQKETRQAKPSYRRSLAPFFSVTVKYYDHSLRQSARGLALVKR